MNAIRENLTTYVDLTGSHQPRRDISAVTLLHRSLSKNLCDQRGICSRVTFSVNPGNFHFVADLTAFELE